MTARILCVVPERALDDAQLGAAGFRVLAALGAYWDANGCCCPALSDLARRLRLSRQAVGHHIRELRALGYIEVRPRMLVDGTRLSNRYRLLSGGGEAPISRDLLGFADPAALAAVEPLGSA